MGGVYLLTLISAPTTVAWIEDRRLVRSNFTFQETGSAPRGDSMVKSSQGPSRLNLKLGERVRLVLINDTMMEHPIHLHGLWSELENGHGEFTPYKPTIVEKPAERLSYLVSADTPGHWAYHCHLLYHMEAGMFRTVVVL